MKRIIAASSNAHKIKEIQAIMSKFGMEVVSRKDAGVPEFEIVEDGETFEENSLKKASEIMKAFWTNGRLSWWRTRSVFC